MGTLLEPDDIREQLQSQLLLHYDLPEDTKVYHLKYSENFTYRLESEMTGEKYVLRVNRPGYHDLTELESELSWIRAVKRDTDIRTADVLPGKDGKLIQQLALAGSTDKYVCSLFSFVEGIGIRGMSTEELIPYQKQIGAITAKLHLHAMSWNADNSLPRFHWDIEDMFGDTSRWGDWSKNPALTESQKEIFSQTVAIGCKRLEKYGKKPDRYGLIHSDLNINNILVDGDQVKILDFDDCGYGWFLFDLSTAVLEYDTNLSEMTRAWLDGYQTVRPLSAEDLQEVDTFIVLRKIVRMGWIASHWDNDTVKRVTDRYYTETEKLARAYCETNGGCL